LYGRRNNLTLSIENLDRKTEFVVGLNITDDHIQIFRLQRSYFLISVNSFSRLLGIFVIVFPYLL
jgi:hypothetical protein